MKTIICGSRSINNKSLVYQCIKESGFNITEIVSGCSIGIDLNAIEIAEELAINISKFPARWEDLTEYPQKIKIDATGRKYNSLSGFNRNQRMIDYIGSDGGVIAIWDGYSNGTKNTINLAKKNNIKIFIKIVQ